MTDTSMVTVNNRTITVPKWLASWIITLLTASVLGLVGMVFGVWRETAQQEARIVAIESNRFTSGDALLLIRDLPTIRDYEALRLEILGIKTRLDTYLSQGTD